MYSVFKGQVVPEDVESTQIIDSNDRISAAIERYNEELKQRREEELKHRVEDFLDQLEADEEGLPILPTDEEGNYLLPVDFDGNPLLYVHSDGMLSEEPEPEAAPEEAEEEEEALPTEEEIAAQIEAKLADAQQKADKIIAEAEDAASGILDEATAQAEKMKEEAAAAGKEEGYAAGSETAQAEYAKKEQQLLDRQSAMEKDFADRESSMEERLCDIVCDIVGKVFAIEFFDKKEIIAHIVDNVVTNSPSSKEFLIRVNDANYELINEQKESLKEKVGSGIELDIVRDPLLTAEQCQIETDGGVYDCGMDVQLANLLKDIRALSIA